MLLSLSFIFGLCQESITVQANATVAANQTSNSTNTTNGTATSAELSSKSIYIVGIVIVSFMVAGGVALCLYDRRRIAREKA